MSISIDTICILTRRGIYAAVTLTIIGSDDYLYLVRRQLSEPMRSYCQFDPNEHISVKFYLKFKTFH